MLMNGGRYVSYMWVQRFPICVYGKSLDLALNFALNLTLFHKINSTKNKTKQKTQPTNQNKTKPKPLSGPLSVAVASLGPGTYFWLASISNRADRAEVPFFPTGGPAASRECAEMGPAICKPFMAAPF